VRERPQLRTLAGNPLLLTVIALIVRRQELPSARASLYEHALQVFCHQWDFEDKKLELPADSPLKDLNLGDKLAVLRRIAWSMLEGEGLRANIIRREDLEKIIRGYFEAEWWPGDKSVCRRGASEMIKVLEQRNYVICQQGAELYGFIHRTFLEYLCAAEILWRIEKDRSLSVAEMCDRFVVSHCEDDSWHEVIRLLAAQLQPRDAVTLVESLLRHPIKRWDLLADEVAPSLTLAIGCLGERRPRDQRHFAALKAAVVEHARDDRDPSVRQAAVEALGQHFASDTGIRSLLIEWAAEDPHGDVRRAASGTLGRYAAGDPEMRSLLIERAKDADPRVREAAMYALGQRVAGDPEVRSLLIERAKDAADFRVRSAAISTLGWHAAGDPEMRSLLIERAKDADEGVREAAIWALGQHDAGDSGIRSLLIERAAEDPDGDVRQAASSALERHAAGDPEMRSLLIERAKDADPRVRSAAIYALGRHAAGDSEMRSLLIERAKDADEGVREAVIWALGQRDAGDPEVRSLLIERTKDDHAPVRAAAIDVLRRHAAGDPEMRSLLIERAEDADEGVRRAAIEGWFVHFGDRTSAVLLSRDLDAHSPGLDPRQGIDHGRIAAAARALRVNEVTFARPMNAWRASFR
jgi:HEAT repeat protein